MRKDQLEKLRLLEERLADQVILDVDPENWPGHGLTLAVMDQETRGNALWARKVAAQGIMVLQKVQVLMADPAAAAGKSEANESDVDKLTKKAEKEASDLLERVRKKGRAHASGTQH